MPVINRIAGFAPEMETWRKALHQMPELGFDCVNTAAYVAEKLREFGVDELHEGIAQTGLVALIHGQGGGAAGHGSVIGLRADMDALPIAEETGAEHASARPGVMHACGHDGHSTMLLGAAKYLCETRGFSGTVALIFQPAEEDGGGAGVMVEEGIMERFGITEVYALHNVPGLEEGVFATTPGPIMAAVDTFHIDITGQGGHGAMPHETRDPVVAAVGIVQAIQTISSRNHYALDDLVISVTQIHTGSAENIVPETAYINGTVRTFDSAVQDMVERRMGEIVSGLAAGYGVRAELRYDRHYPATVNDADKAGFAADIAAGIVGEDAVIREAGREMGAEDFAYMLAARPGAYMFLGQGAGPGLHTPQYDFNDGIAPLGASYFVRLVEAAQPLDRGAAAAAAAAQEV